jgi:aminoglycoside phosphotransferase (APT) family kinase protein
MLQTPEENVREMRYDELNRKVKQFKSRLTRLKNKNDDQGIIDLWAEFKEWCDNHMYPDNWRLWFVAAEDAQRRLYRGWKTW